MAADHHTQLLAGDGKHFVKVDPTFSLVASIRVNGHNGLGTPPFDPLQ